LSVGTESTKERLEEEYKFKVQRLKAALKYKGRGLEVNPKVFCPNFGVHFTAYLPLESCL
ncbi:MAG: hypothetical protein J6Q48_03525, partial [Bacteroidaceae bacterium]|nr:hypothetical protein [Bacteroidaceae bacterium]